MSEVADPLATLTEEERRTVEETKAVLARMPDTDPRTAIEELAKEDRALWAMYYRRLRGNRLAFDVSPLLTEDSLAKLREQYKTKPQRAETEEKIRLRRHRPFLLQPLRDDHPHKVYEKGRQVGVSEIELTEAVSFLHQNQNENVKWVYTFPRDQQLREFSMTRIAPMFNETPRIRRILTRPDGIYVKKIGKAFMMLRSAWEENLGEGIDADGVTLDEKDRMREGVESAFTESLSSSRFGLLREVSTPTLPGYGIDKPFKDSDQQAWLVKCVKCGLDQEIEWPDNITEEVEIKPGSVEIPDDAYAYRCRKEKCRGLLDRLHGRWVPKFPSRKAIRGYHIPQLIAPWISATDVMRKKVKMKFLQLWINYVLGKTSKGEKILLSDSHFERCCAGYELFSDCYGDTPRDVIWQDVSVGIDWGNLNWVTVIGRNAINDQPYLIALYIVPDTSEELGQTKRIIQLIEPFRPGIVVADFGFGKDRNNLLLKKFGGGKFYACVYNKAEKGGRGFQPTWSADAAARVLVDRTMTLKEAARAIREREVGLPDLSIHEVQLLMQHFKNLAPIYEQDDENEDPVETIGKVGDDHFAHSTGYAWLGYDKLTQGGHFHYDFA